MKVRVSRRASRQIEAVHRWLSERRPAAADAFLDEFYLLRKRLSAYPRSAPVIQSPNVHQAAVSGFPCVVVYRVTTRGVMVVGVFHTSRDPKVRTRR